MTPDLPVVEFPPTKDWRGCGRRSEARTVAEAALEEMAAGLIGERLDAALARL